jgi:hypothetical protein
MSPSEITRRIKRRAFATFFQKTIHIKKTTGVVIFGIEDILETPGKLEKIITAITLTHNQEHKSINCELTRIIALQVE